MKTAVFLALTLLHMCNIVSTGAAPSRETSNDPALNVMQVKAYESLLERLLREASKEIPENAAFEKNIDLGSFDQENIFGDEQMMIVTEEEQGTIADDELSTVEDNRIIESVGSGMHCSWKGLHGQCCQSVKIFKRRHSICIFLDVSPPAQMRVSMRIDGRQIFSYTFGIGHKSYSKCIGLGNVKVCFKLYDLSLSLHHVKVCFRLSARLGVFKFRKNLGCIEKRFALDEIPTTANKPDSFDVHKEYIYNSPPRRYVHDNNVLRFET